MVWPGADALAGKADTSWAGEVLVSRIPLQPFFRGWQGDTSWAGEATAGV